MAYETLINLLEQMQSDLEDVISEKPVTLPRRLWDRLSALMEELSEMQAELEEAPDAVQRERHEDVLLVQADEIARDAAGTTDQAP